MAKYQLNPKYEETLTLREAVERKIDFKKTEAYFWVSYLECWERVNYVTGNWDLNTQSPTLSGYLGASTWMVIPESTICIPHNDKSWSGGVI